MEFPKIVYDDYYKFLMSVGIIFLIAGGIGISYISINKIIGENLIIFIFYIIIIITGIKLTCFAGNKWYTNQKLHDRKLLAETNISELAATRMLKPEETIYKTEFKESKRKTDKKTALVSYEITSILPNAALLNLIKDKKVWFVITNHEEKKYRAYIYISFLIEGKEITKASDPYYGGTKAWNLNALSEIRAPGLKIPDEIIENAKEKKKIEIRINCEIKDENDKLIEKKLPQGYIYHYQTNSWYLEP